MISTATRSSKINLPAGFATKTLLIATGIIIFILIYLILLVSFAYLFLQTAKWTSVLISEHISIYSVLVFVGANGFLLMILFFLAKVFFGSDKKETATDKKIEVFEKDYPQLFKLIYEVADSVNTHRPRRVFLLPDVNASVFHEQSFFSLLFPSRQNLNIGLGLVSITNISELKGILGHEFGHFSQNITRVSGFIYRVNKLIIELLYTDDDWENTLRKASEIHGLLSIFAYLTLGTARVIKFVFRKIYELVNLPYMSLSRDLEFHADAVALSLVGGEPMKNSLRKIDLGMSIYDYTLRYMDEFLAKGQKCNNIYEVFSWNVHNLALKNDMPIQHGQPVITDEYLAGRAKSRVMYKDQWASHPETSEREKEFSKHTGQYEYDYRPAWSLFDNAEQVQQQMTDLIYASALAAGNKIETEPASSIIEKIRTETDSLEVSPLFNRFYNNRVPNVELAKLLQEYNAEKAAQLRFDEIYSTQSRYLIDKYDVTLQDRDTVQAIQEKKIRTSFFEFENKRLKVKSSNTVLQKLDKEIEDNRTAIDKLDADAFYYNLYHASQRGVREEYINNYTAYLVTSKLVVIAGNMLGYLNMKLSLFSVEVNDDSTLKSYLSEIRKVENSLKTELASTVTEKFTGSIEDGVFKTTLEKYIKEKSDFFLALFSVNETEVQRFFDFLNTLNNYASEQYNKALKILTDMQAGWAKN